MKPKEIFVKLLFLIAKRANYELDDYEADLIWQNLSQFGIDAVNASLNDFLRSMRSQDKFPSISELEAKCVRLKGIPEGSTPDISQAAEIAEKMWGAISKFGYINSEGASKYIGPLGWAIIERQGGWKSFCEGVTTDQKGFLIPQWRKSLEQSVETSRLRTAYAQLTGGETRRDLPEKASPASPAQHRLGAIASSLSEVLAVPAGRKVDVF